MVEPKDATSGGAKTEKMAVAKIEPAQIEATTLDVKPSDTKEVHVDAKIEVEKSVISATILLLREYGIRKSGAAIRDAVDSSHKFIGPKEAVRSLSSLGFKASFGLLNIENLSDEFFPVIAFKKNGEAVVVLTAPADGRILTTNPISRTRQK
jgi:ATP-binding cassette subfamily C protein LapB